MKRELKRRILALECLLGLMGYFHSAVNSGGELLAQVGSPYLTGTLARPTNNFIVPAPPPGTPPPPPPTVPFNPNANVLRGTLVNPTNSMIIVPAGTVVPNQTPNPNLNTTIGANDNVNPATMPPTSVNATGGPLMTRGIVGPTPTTGGITGTAPETAGNVGAPGTEAPLNAIPGTNGIPGAPTNIFPRATNNPPGTGNYGVYPGTGTNGVPPVTPLLTNNAVGGTGNYPAYGTGAGTANGNPPQF